MWVGEGGGTGLGDGTCCHELYKVTSRFDIRVVRVPRGLLALSQLSLDELVDDKVDDGFGDAKV